MKSRRNFPIELKRHIVKEWLRGTNTAAQLISRYNISSGLLYHWKAQYAGGRFDDVPIKHTSLKKNIIVLRKRLKK